MRWLFRRFWLPLYRYWALRYIRREQEFRYGALRLQVPPGVFHPGVFFSTPVLLDFLKTIDLHGKQVLDVGTGSGALALFAARQGATALALDINPAAVETARQNAAALGLPLETLHSDLFDALQPGRQFDILLINPPYYPKAPATDAERAFFAGEQLEYFENLFRQLRDRLRPGGRTWMILSEDCDLEKIQELAGLFGLRPTVVYERKKWGERLMVYQIGLD